MSEQLRVLVCGGRTYSDLFQLFAVLDTLDVERGIGTIIHGGARGADSLAGKWADVRGKACRVVFADWEIHGRAAGPKRNQQMIDEHHPDVTVAFPGGIGTADMVRRSKAANIAVYEIT